MDAAIGASGASEGIPVTVAPGKVEETMRARVARQKGEQAAAAAAAAAAATATGSVGSKVAALRAVRAVDPAGERATHVSVPSSGSSAAVADDSAGDRATYVSVPSSDSPAAGTKLPVGSREAGLEEGAKFVHPYDIPSGDVALAAGVLTHRPVRPSSSSESTDSFAFAPAAAAMRSPVFPSWDAKLPTLRSSPGVDLVEGPYPKGVIYYSSSKSPNLFMQSWNDFWRINNLLAPSEIKKITRMYDILSNAKSFTALNDRAKKGAILEIKSSPDQYVTFFDYNTFKKGLIYKDDTGIFRRYTNEAQKANELGMSLGILGERDEAVIKSDRKQVVSLLMKGVTKFTRGTIVGICYSTCEDSSIDRPTGLGGKKAYPDIRLICEQTENKKEVKILFVRNVGRSNHNNIFFMGRSEFRSGELTNLNEGTLLIKRNNSTINDSDMLYVIKGKFNGDGALTKKTDNAVYQFDTKFNTSMGKTSLVETPPTEKVQTPPTGKVYGYFGWNFRSEYFPYYEVENTNYIDYLNWNFGWDRNSLKISKDTLLANASTCDAMYYTRVNFESGNFEVIERRNYDEPFQQLPKKLNRTFFKFRYTTKSPKKTFCIELIIDDRADFSSVSRLRVYTISSIYGSRNDGALVKRGLFVKFDESKILSVQLLAQEGDEGKDLSGSQYTTSTTSPKTESVKLKVFLSQQREREINGRSLSDKCGNYDDIYEEIHMENCDALQKCYDMFFNAGNGKFSQAMAEINKSITDTADACTYVNDVISKAIRKVNSGLQEAIAFSNSSSHPDRKSAVLYIKLNNLDSSEERAALVAAERNTGDGDSPYIPPVSEHHYLKPRVIARVIGSSYGNFNDKHVIILSKGTGENWMVQNSDNEKAYIPSSNLGFLIDPERFKAEANRRDILLDLDNGDSVEQYFIEDDNVEGPPSLPAHLVSGGPAKLEIGGIAYVSIPPDESIRANKLVFLRAKNNKIWTVTPTPGTDITITEEALTPYLSYKDTYSEYNRIYGTGIVNATAIWNLILNPPIESSTISSAHRADTVTPPIPAAARGGPAKLESGCIARVNTNYFDKRLHDKHVYLEKRKDLITWTTWYYMSPPHADIEERFLTPILSRADTLSKAETDLSKLKETLVTLDSRAAAAPVAAAAAAAPVIPLTLERWGIAKVRNGDERVQTGKLVYLTSIKDSNTWNVLPNFGEDTHVMNASSLDPYMTREQVDNIKESDKTRKVPVKETWDRLLNPLHAAGIDVGGGRRGTRKYRGRRGNGANMRRRLTRKAKGQAGGGGRRGSGSGGPGSKRRGGKMYRKTMKHVRRGRGGRKGRKGHRRTIKKYHRR